MTGVTNAGSVVGTPKSRCSRTRVAGAAEGWNLGCPRHVLLRWETTAVSTWVGTHGRPHSRRCRDSESGRYRVQAGIADFFPQSLLFHERRQTDKGAELFVVGCCRAFPPGVCSDSQSCTTVLCGNLLVSRMVIVSRQTDLLEVVAATHAAAASRAA